MERKAGSGPLAGEDNFKMGSPNGEKKLSSCPFPLVQFRTDVYTVCEMYSLHLWRITREGKGAAKVPKRASFFFGKRQLRRSATLPCIGTCRERRQLSFSLPNCYISSSPQERKGPRGAVIIPISIFSSQAFQAFGY